ncbi:MAG: His-Xaa-Ser system protein HxsD [Candidatus Binatia bacterium]
MGGSQEARQSRLDFTLGTDHIAFEIDEQLYPLEALYGACYLFLDRCYVFLSRAASGGVAVRLTARESANAAELDALAGEFGNELLSQSLRLELSRSTARIREYYTAAALRSAAAAPTVDELLAELESEELLEDPLEIMVPWEESQGTKSNEPESK